MLIQTLIEKYKDVIPYAVFGVLTTIVNVASYWLCARLLGFSVMPSTYIAWFAAVLFAYITNRKWVFKSSVHGKAIIIEALSFFSCRILTGLMDWFCMYIFVNVLLFNDITVKTFANISVIVTNYLASKFIIFGKHSEFFAKRSSTAQNCRKQRDC
mgnify:FL=1